MSVAIESHRQNTQAASSEFLLNEDTLPELQGLCVEKIRNAAVGGDLAHHQKLLYILHRWSEWSSADEPKEWIRKQIESREGLMDLIKGSLTPVRTQGLGDRVSQTHLRFDPENLEAFIDLVELEKTLTELDQHIDTDEGKKTIRIALRGLVRKREGKGGSLGLDDDDG
jgi:predicted KAP-like P-loop ATPase